MENSGSNSVLSKCVDLGGGYKDETVWVQLESASRIWKSQYSRFKADGKLIELDSVLCDSVKCAEKLAKFSSDAWIQFSHAVGWTPTSVCALSWCRGATPHSVISFWSDLNGNCETEIFADFPARLLNPQILPSNRLSSMLNLSTDQGPLTLMLAANTGNLQVDVSKNVLETFSPKVRTMVRERAV